jgi:hypothetical protein
MSQRLLPPLKQILQRRRRRRAETLLEQLGMGGRDERPIQAPPRRDPMVWNLAMVVAVVLLYFLVRGANIPSPAAPFVMPAEFTVPPDYPGAVRALERLSGDTALGLMGVDQNGDPRSTPGVEVRASDGNGLVLAVQDSFLARGFYLFVAHQGFGAELDRVGLFPGRDSEEIIRLMGTNGWNYDIGPDSVVAWLRGLQKIQPFVLTGIGYDWIKGRFTGSLGDADGLARRFYAMCPDIVDQGTGSVVELEREMRETRTLYCWWD